MSKCVEFYFDLGSPATYLAYTQLPSICEQTASQLIYQPMLLGGVFKATGNASPATIAAKGRYMFQDLQRYARRYGVAFALNPHFPINTLLLMRAVTGMQMRHPERFIAFIDCLFRALWVEGATSTTRRPLPQSSASTASTHRRCWPWPPTRRSRPRSRTRPSKRLRGGCLAHRACLSVTSCSSVRIAWTLSARR